MYYVPWNKPRDIAAFNSVSLRLVFHLISSMPFSRTPRCRRLPHLQLDQHLLLRYRNYSLTSHSKVARAQLCVVNTYSTLVGAFDRRGIIFVGASRPRPRVGGHLGWDGMLNPNPWNLASWDRGMYNPASLHVLVCCFGPTKRNAKITDEAVRTGRSAGTLAEQDPTNLPFGQKSNKKFMLVTDLLRLWYPSHSYFSHMYYTHCALS